MNDASLPLRTLLLSAVLAAAPFQSQAASNDLQLRGLSGAEVPTATRFTGRLIVRYRDTVGSDNARLAIVSTAARRANVLRTAAGASRAAPVNARMLRRTGTGASLLRIAETLSPSEQDNLLRELRADPAVDYAQFDRMMYAVDHLAGPVAATPAATTPPDDPRYANFQWHLQDGPGGIRAPQAWAASTGAGTVVAVLDTGILPDHPDLKRNDHILPGYDFISSAFISRRPTDERVPGALDMGDWLEENNACFQPPRDSSWHGTHTAGTIGELTNNGIGGAGVAHDAQILPIRVLGQCGGSGADIADAILWASGGHIDGVPDNTHPAEVISLSLGGPGSCDSDTQRAIDGAVANGSVVVVAAGNDASNAAQSSPASCRNVVNVGATRITGGIAFYSNFGSSVDLAGPGGGAFEDPGNNQWDGFVLSTGYTGKTTPTSGDYTYVGQAGTSMATPHVAAVAALVQSYLAGAGKRPLTPAQLETLLRQTARPFPVAPPLSTPIGSGIVDAAAALDYVQNNCIGAGCPPVTLPLSNRQPLVAQSVGEGDQLVYSYTATAGSALNLLSFGGGGNVAMYVKFGEQPTTASYDLRSVRTGSAQTIRLAAPRAGTYYITLIGGTGGFNNISLMARQ
ncbi:S8 family peptidase [Xanthomonas melonis]|uniref:S8 family peptidase n=1 Tax=Xanthomonas melonis TaxID=56456 RepID=UPI003EBC1E8F